MSCGHICSKTNRYNVLSIHDTTETDGGGARLRGSSACGPQGCSISKALRSCPPKRTTAHPFHKQPARAQSILDLQTMCTPNPPCTLGSARLFASRKVRKMCRTKIPAFSTSCVLKKKKMQRRCFSVLEDDFSQGFFFWLLGRPRKRIQSDFCQQPSS